MILIFDNNVMITMESVYYKLGGNMNQTAEQHKKN